MGTLKILKNGTTIAFLNDAWEPVDLEEATLVKIIKPDGNVYFGAIHKEENDIQER